MWQKQSGHVVFYMTDNQIITLVRLANIWTRQKKE